MLDVCVNVSMNMISVNSHISHSRSFAVNSLPANIFLSKTDEKVSKSATLDVPSCEPGYVELKKERRLPPVTKFTKVNKAKNVIRLWTFLCNYGFERLSVMLHTVVTFS